VYGGIAVPFEPVTCVQWHIYLNKITKEMEKAKIKVYSRVS